MFLLCNKANLRAVFVLLQNLSDSENFRHVQPIFSCSFNMHFNCIDILGNFYSITYDNSLQNDDFGVASMCTIVGKKVNCTKCFTIEDKSQFVQGKERKILFLYLLHISSLSVQPRDNQNVSTSNNLPESDENRYARNIW